MRSILNLVTIIFVVGALYLAVQSPTVQNLVKEYSVQVRSDVANLNGGTPISFNLKSITDSFATLMNLGQGGGDQIIPQIVTPGPLSKISTATSTTVAVGSTQISSVPNTAGQAPPAAPSPSSTTLLDSGGIIINTNVQRADNGVATLSESSKLDASALVKAKDILARQYFEHTAPDGKTVADLVTEQGYTYIKIGENLALGDFTSDSDVVTAWMNSAGHRANILDPQFKEIGVGVAYGLYQGRYVYVAVQHFGRPTSACPTIDEDLKAEVEAGQTKLTNESDALQAEKAAIDQGIAAGTDESEQITAYNAGVEGYQADYAKVDSERVEYNNEVVAFNQCLSSTS